MSDLVIAWRQLRRTVGFAVSAVGILALDAFGVRAAYGRVLGPDDYRPGHNTVAVLTWRFWREHFHGDVRAVGATVRLDGQPHTIVWVLSDRFETGILLANAPRDLFLLTASLQDCRSL